MLSPTNLQVLFQTLEGRGYNLLVAKTGETALVIADKAHPHLILLDIMMPVMDGYEVCRQLKADRTTQEIPEIFLSALGDTKDKVQGLDLGAVDYITKGECYDFERLCEKFAEGCENDVRKSMTMISEDVNRFADGLPAQDDQAMLVFRVE